MNVNVVGQRLVEYTQIELLVSRIQVMEGTIQMMADQIRCLNIRHGSQPIELPDVKAEGVFDQTYQDGLDFIQPEVRNMLGLNFEPQFGADEEAWAK